MAKREVQDLDQLIKESEEAIKRLEAAQRGGRGLPLSQRIAKHLKKNSSSFINIALTGSVLVVALGRLSQKYQHEVRCRCSKGFALAATEGWVHAGMEPCVLGLQHFPRCRSEQRH